MEIHMIYSDNRMRGSNCSSRAELAKKWKNNWMQKITIQLFVTFFFAPFGLTKRPEWRYVNDISWYIYYLEVRLLEPIFLQAVVYYKTYEQSGILQCIIVYWL